MSNEDLSDVDVDILGYNVSKLTNSEMFVYANTIYAYNHSKYCSLDTVFTTLSRPGLTRYDIGPFEY